MAKKEPTPQEQIKNFAAEIIREAARWESLNTKGGSDPFWEDGSNMNLVRNHIIYAKGRIDDLCQQAGAEHPQEYYTETPPEVDNRYMARAQEIRDNGVKSLAAYKSNPDYIYLVHEAVNLSDEEQKATCINAVLGYVKGLESFVREDDLLSMRRHEHPEAYLESFRACRAKVEAFIKGRVQPAQEQEIRWEDADLSGQVTIFDWLGGMAAI